MTALTLKQNLIQFAQKVGEDIKELSAQAGSLARLSTENKHDLVSAINELYTKLTNLRQTDEITMTSEVASFSAQEAQKRIDNAINQLKETLLGGEVDSAFDTLKELGEYLKKEQDIGSALTTKLATITEQITALSLLAEGLAEVNLEEVYNQAKKGGL